MTFKLGRRGSTGGRGAAGDLADQIAIQGLTFLAADAERLDRFFGVTGLDVTTLRRAAESPGFMASVLDYLGSDEPLLRAFAQEHDYDPAEVDAARRHLSHLPGEET